VYSIPAIVNPLKVTEGLLAFIPLLTNPFLEIMLT
jgi:hypothetical protein